MRYGPVVLEPTVQRGASAWRRIDVHWAGEGLSTVIVGDGASAALGELWERSWHEAAIVADAQVMALHGAALGERLARLVRRVVCCEFPAGEPHKSRATKEQVEDRLLGQGFGRDGCVVALGGGISLDLAGFVAATYLRGVPSVYVPTSLLAQVDAALGGKTGVNTPHGKNLVGAFHQPRLVLVDPGYLGTLPPSERANGLAEVVKHAVIADAALFAWLEAHARELGAPSELDQHAITRCLEIKGEIVAADEREQGRRAVLSFGHTIGHALEAASAHRLAHGQAVAVGMLVEGRVACGCRSFSEAELGRLRRVLGALGLPDSVPELDFERLCPFLGIDKKRRQAELRLALPSAIGRASPDPAEPTVAIALDALRRAWEAR